MDPHDTTHDTPHDDEAVPEVSAQIDLGVAPTRVPPLTKE